MIVWRGTIPLSIKPSFWVLAAFIGWMSASTLPMFVQWIAIVLVSVLVHELGHALTAKWWGQKVSIELGPMGGLTSFQGSSLSRIKEFIVVVAGPLCGFGLYMLSLLALKWDLFGPSASYFFLMMAWANLFWSVLNLIPVHPLDGGKLMGITLEGLFGAAGMRVSYFLSGFFAILATALFLVTGNVIASALFLLCAFESFRSWQTARYYRTTSSENLIDELEKAELDWHHSQPERAITRLEALVKKQSSGEIFDRALERLSHFLVSSGQNGRAVQLLLPYKDKLSNPALKLFQLACYKQRNWQQALDAGKKVFLEEQDIPCAILNAYASAHINDVISAINWLAFVKKTNQVDMKSILASDDFDECRERPEFKSFALRCG